MKTFILILLCCMICSTLTAQTPKDKKAGFHFSFIPPLSTHGPLAAEYTNTVSFNLLAGISKNEEAFTFGGLSNIIYDNANGFQFAGLSNYAGNNGHGMMFAGLANIVKNNYYGFQFSGLINTAKTTKGFQFGGLINKATRMKGIQFGGLGNKSTALKGFQFGGLVNIAHQVTGFQFAGLINTAKAIKGVQFGGLTNKATEVKGMQFTGLGNIANDLKGFQFGGLFNIAHQVSGVQFAGLINIADSCDYPIALLNIIKKGEYGLSITYNEMGSTLLTFRSGGRVTYGILGIGYNHKTKGSGFTTEGGFGAHINIAKWFRINNEIKGGCTNNFSSDKSTFYINYALLPGFRLDKHLEIFAGPSLNYLQSDNTANTKIFPNHSIWKKHNDSRLQQVYVGYQVGVQYIF